MMNKIIPISKKARKKLRLARYPALAMTHVYIGSRRCPQYRQFILSFYNYVALPLSFPSRRRRVFSAEEQVSKAYAPHVPARSRAYIKFLGSVVMTSRWTSSPLYVDVRGSPLVDCFIYFCAIFSADNPTVRMPTLPLLFILTFLQLLALGSLSLSQIVVLVLLHIPMIHVVVFFLNFRINLCVTNKLLLFLTGKVVKLYFLDYFYVLFVTFESLRCSECTCLYSCRSIEGK
jgi:hypothetical protein